MDAEQLVRLEREAKKALESQDYPVVAITYIPRGRNHNNFYVTMPYGREAVARFKKPKEDLHAGKLELNARQYLEREAAIMKLVSAAGLPAPKVYGVQDYGDTSFLLVEKLPGVLWAQFIRESGYGLESYLKSLEFLGADLATLHRTQLDSYGTITPEGIKQGGKSITAYLSKIFGERLTAAEQKEGLFTKPELDEIRRYFRESLQGLAEEERRVQPAPTLILYDIHPNNHLVDARGKPSGYFDLEFCQSGLPVMDIFMLKLQLFNYFDSETFSRAEESFLSAYRGSGGRFDHSKFNRKMEELLSAGQGLAASINCYGVKDGVIDTWSEQDKEFMFRVIDNGKIDYVYYGNIIRSYTKQPKTPRIHKN